MKTSQSPASKKLNVKSSHIENYFGGALILLLAALPLVELFLRLFLNLGIPAISKVLIHIPLWIAFIAGIIASRDGEHLTLSLEWNGLSPLVKKWIARVVTVLCGAIILGFAVTAFSWLVLAYSGTGDTVGFVPIQMILFIMPVGFFVIFYRFTNRFIRENELTGNKKVLWIAAVLLGVFLSLSPLSKILSFVFPSVDFFYSMENIYFTIFPFIKWPLLILLLGCVLFGSPIFVLLGGVPYFFMSGDWGTLEALPNAGYKLLTGNEIAAIPLFTLTGFILAGSQAGQRFVAFLKDILSWLPGGLAIVAIVICTFFTTFTGASGVTILALGGLLSFILLQSGEYSEKYTQGLITSSGSSGLLFAPSLPLIMYGVAAQRDIRDFFKGGFIPGLLLVLSLVVTGVIASLINRKKARGNEKKDIQNEIQKEKFKIVNPFRLLLFVTAIKLTLLLIYKDIMWLSLILVISLVLDIVVFILHKKSHILNNYFASIGELLLPVVIILIYFTGITSLVMTASIAVIYVFILEVFIHGDLKVREMEKVLGRCLPVLGGVLIILVMANGLGDYIIEMEIPMMITGFFSDYVSSKIVFLLLLNLILLLTGCLLDIYSAILIVAPLIIPLGVLYGIHPVHLGVIFLVNLEMGYLTPPVGLNLFLASYTFKKPVVAIYKQVAPFLLLRLGVTLLITFVPWFSTVLLFE